MARQIGPENIGETKAASDPVVEVQTEIKSATMPTNFRVSKETAAQFRNLAGGFANQEAALATLMEVYKKAELKKSMPAYAGEIENFQKYLNILDSMYVAVLKQFTVADESARASVQKELQGKQEEIRKLNEKIEGTKQSLQELNDVKTRAEVAEGNVEKLEGEKIELTNSFNAQKGQLTQLIDMKNEINKGLAKEVEELNTKLEAYSKLPEKLEGLEKELSEKKDELRETEYEHKVRDLEKQAEFNEKLMDLQQKHAGELEELRSAFRKREDEIRVNYDKRVDAILKNGHTQEESGDS